MTTTTEKAVFALLFALCTLLFGACVRPTAPTQSEWLPDATGWELVDVDDTQPPQWVLYERNALVADVKEFRIVGLIDAEPELAMRALRFRLLDDQYIPDGLQRDILHESASEVVIYGRTPLPFPFHDREATERLVFSHDEDTGVFRVDAGLIDPGDEPPKGVVRAPVIENSWVLAPTGSGQSVFTIDTVHDVGGRLLNTLIYKPVRKGLVEDVHTIEDLAASMEDPR